MKMTHKNCGGEVTESKSLPPYDSDDHGTVEAYECSKCMREILGDYQIEFIPENEADRIQIESLKDIHTPVIECYNCDWAGLGFFSFWRRLWNAWFLCNDCGRVMRITAIITAILMTAIGWFY